VAIDAEVVSLIKTLEQDFNCSGLCEPAQFWASKSIKLGAPTESCIFSLKDSFDDNMVLLGWSIVSTAIFVCLILLSHCGLYLSSAPKTKSTVSKKRFIFD
jgi:hypothetical protein